MEIQKREVNVLTEFSLFDKTSTLDGVYVTFMVNRLQMLYLLLIMPIYLVQPYMIWAILAVGVLSHFNLMILSKWFASDYSVKGYQGFSQLLGRPLLRFLAFLGLPLLLLKISILVLGYSEIVQQFVFPAIDSNWMLLFLMVVSIYMAAQGMEKTIRFIVIAFFCTIWMIVLYYSFFTYPIASLSDLYPLIPENSSDFFWKGILLIWSSLSGPEFLIFLAPWLGKDEKIPKYLSIGNAITVIEYLLLFVATQFFFGADLIRQAKFPMIEMIRYLQLPVFERIEIILIALYMFHFLFTIAIFLIYFYGGLRIIFQKRDEPINRLSFFLTCLFIYVSLVLLNEWLWEEEQNVLVDFHIWAGAVSYIRVPSFLVAMTKIKERTRSGTF